MSFLAGAYGWLRKKETPGSKVATRDDSGPRPRASGDGQAPADQAGARRRAPGAGQQGDQRGAGRPAQ